MSKRANEGLEIILCFERSDVGAVQLVQTRCALMSLEEELGRIGFAAVRFSFSDRSSMKSVSREKI